MEQIKTKIKVDAEEASRVQNEIGLARQMCATAGNNDSEFFRLDEILTLYKTGQLSADQAIDQARAVPAGKIER